MTEETVRAEWTALRARLDAQARESKDSQAVIVELSDQYGLLDQDRRRIVNKLLAEWLLSDDERLRFDALALIDDHLIVDALPALDELEARLETSTAPGAPYERAKVLRVKTRMGQSK